MLGYLQDQGGNILHCQPATTTSTYHYLTPASWHRPHFVSPKVFFWTFVASRAQSCIRFSLCHWVTEGLQVISRHGQTSCFILLMLFVLADLIYSLIMLFTSPPPPACCRPNVGVPTLSGPHVLSGSGITGSPQWGAGSDTKYGLIHMWAATQRWIKLKK